MDRVDLAALLSGYADHEFVERELLNRRPWIFRTTQYSEHGAVQLLMCLKLRPAMFLSWVVRLPVTV